MTGEVSNYQNEQERSNYMDAAQYQSGVNRYPNPAYEQALQV